MQLERQSNMTIVSTTTKVGSNIRLNGREIFVGDDYIYYNGHHIIFFTCIIDNGEFKLDGRYCNALVGSRKCRHSLKRIVSKSKKRNHIMIWVDYADHALIREMMYHQIVFAATRIYKKKSEEESKAIVNAIVPVMKRTRERQQNPSKIPRTTEQITIDFVETK